MRVEPNHYLVYRGSTLPINNSMNNEIPLILTLIRRRCPRHYFSLPHHPHRIPPLHQ